VFNNSASDSFRRSTTNTVHTVHQYTKGDMFRRCLETVCNSKTSGSWAKAASDLGISIKDRGMGAPFLAEARNVSSLQNGHNN
jgi:hypothetical protein